MSKKKKIDKNKDKIVKSINNNIKIMCIGLRMYSHTSRNKNKINKYI